MDIAARIIELALQGHWDTLLPPCRTNQARSQIAPDELLLIEHCQAPCGGKDMSPAIINGKPVLMLLVS